MRKVAVGVIGGGQTGLAMGRCLRRAGLPPSEDFVTLDAADRPGGAWPQIGTAGPRLALDVLLAAGIDDAAVERRDSRVPAP